MGISIGYDFFLARRDGIAVLLDFEMVRRDVSDDELEDECKRLELSLQDPVIAWCAQRGDQICHDGCLWSCILFSRGEEYG